MGFQQASSHFRGVKGQFRTLGSIDVDPSCCEDFKRLTGVEQTQMDLFDHQQYTEFWGKAPPPEWREATPADVLKAAQGQCPDVVFLSPPCKGYSGLLPEKSSKSPKYQALNKLVFRSMQLTLEAFQDDLPAAILIENVPRIQTRGAKNLGEVKKLLSMYGYVFHEGVHDCGKIGGLGQTRSRYLLIARNPRKLMSFIYQPHSYELKSIGQVLESIPPPGDTERCGPMHRIPNLQFKTWVRLALIPAGKDWRALNDKDTYANLYQIVPWERHSSIVTGANGVNNGAVSVADPRVENVCGYGNKYRITSMDEPAPVITGSRIGSGAVLCADPKLGYEPRSGAFRVVRWDEVSPTITGNTGTGRSNGVSGISDPRLNYTAFNRALKVTGWKQPSGAITSGDNYVADARGKMKVADWDVPMDTVTGTASVTSSNATAAVADPRLSCSPRSGVYGMADWDKPSKTISANFQVDNATAAVADPRVPDGSDALISIPKDTDSGVWLIIAEDGSWHRPITTYEMAMLQGMPMTFEDGTPLVLAGKSDKTWREHIGNMVPPPAACAMATSMLETMMPNMLHNEWFWNTEIDATIWVRPPYEEENEFEM